MLGGEGGGGGQYFGRRRHSSVLYICKYYVVKTLSIPAYFYIAVVGAREVVFMEGPLGPNMGPSLADVMLCTFASTNAGFSSFSVRKLLS